MLTHLQQVDVKQFNTQMSKKILTLAIAVIMVHFALTSCSWGVGKGDARDRNIGEASVARLDSMPGVEYIGLADTHELEDGNFQAVVIYYVSDSVGNKIERNARVTTNHDGSKIIKWEDLETKMLTDVKQKVSDKMEEKGIPVDDSLIDALIKLKK